MPYADDMLIDHALAARERAYAPYSKFKVGAAIIDENGKIHTGCNVENAAYPLGNCAEASAISAMVAAGSRRITKIAIAGGAERIEDCTPCGGCRQAIAEFAKPDTIILLRKADGSVSRYAMTELLPHAFRLEP